MMLATSRSFGDRNFKESYACTCTHALIMHPCPHAPMRQHIAQAAPRSRPRVRECRNNVLTCGAHEVARRWENVALAMEAAMRAEEGARAAGTDPNLAAEAAFTAHANATADDATGRVPTPPALSLPEDGGGGGGGGGADGGFESVHADGVQPLLSPEPCVMSRALAPADRFVILACDGVWDVLSDQAACDAVSAALAQPHATPDEAARKLVGDAYAAGSEDNISVLVAVLGMELA